MAQTRIRIMLPKVNLGSGGRVKENAIEGEHPVRFGKHRYICTRFNDLYERGHDGGPFLIVQIEFKLEEKIEALLLPLLEGSDLFLTSVQIKPTNNLKVFLDADSGLDIGKSADINRKLYKLIEEAGLFPDGDFSLEVSSPGVDTPLRLPRQFKKNIGRTLEITPITGDVFSGVLQASDDQSLTLSLKGTKKSPPMERQIALNEIKTAIVQIVF